MAQASRVLPSGRKITMRTITGDDELAAVIEAEAEAPVPISEAVKGAGKAQVVVQNWALMRRAVVAIDDKPADEIQSLTPRGFRNWLGTVDAVLARELFDLLNTPTEDEAEASRKSTEISA